MRVLKCQKGYAVEITGYLMVIFHTKVNETNVYIAPSLILCISIISITAAC